jgi:hypothetical protein
MASHSELLKILWFLPISPIALPQQLAGGIVLKRTIVITGIALISALAASAGQITTPTVNVTVTNTSGNALIQQFDPSLGTLTGVTLNFGPASISDLTSISDFEQGGTINITYNMGHMVTFALPVNGPYTPEDFQGLSCTGSGAEFSNCSNSQAISFTFGATSFDLSTAPQAPFLGLGTVAFPYAPSIIENLVGTSIPANPSNLSLQVTNLLLTTTMSLTYTYDTPTSGTPEPASFGMMGAGFCGLIWLARRRATRPRN